RPHLLSSASSSPCLVRPHPPPTSPLFPYTTLFRSLAPHLLRGLQHTACSDEPLSAVGPAHVDPGDDLQHPRTNELHGQQRGCQRSEEHTSELQSRFDLVCRLLLEKKKITYSIAVV